MNKYDNDYRDLINDILINGKSSDDRTGTGTKKIFCRTIRHNMKDGFPMLTLRKMFPKNAIHELLWFLKGDTNIKYLVDNNVNIWNGDCYKKYTRICSSNSNKHDKWMRLNVSENPLINGTLSMYTEKEFAEQIKTNDEFAKEWGELNKVYGSEWIDWYGINQLQEAIDTLKNNPNSRRIMITAWNPVNVKKATLPPCHIMYQLVTNILTLDERISYAIKNINVVDKDDYMKIWSEEMLDKYNVPKHSVSLVYTMRSVDMILGFCQDEIVYAMLLQMIAQCVNMIPDELVANLVDTHIYKNQIGKDLDLMLSRNPMELPILKLNPSIKDIFKFKFEDFEIVNYQTHDIIKFPLSN